MKAKALSGVDRGLSIPKCMSHILRLHRGLYDRSVINRVAIVALCIGTLATAAAAQALRSSPSSSIVGTLSVHRRVIPVFGQRMVYYEAGRGRPLILLANLGSDSNAWFQNFPELARHYRVIAVDLVGMGQSDKPLLDYKMETWTDFIAEFMRLKKIRKATIGGSVMGGALAVQFALDHPELSEGVICAASNSGPGKHEKPEKPEKPERHDGGVKVSSGSFSLAGVRQGLLNQFYNKSLVTDEVVRALFEKRLRANDGYTIQRHLSDHREPYSKEELSRINVPTLFIWCRQDHVTPLSWGEDYAAAVPNARLAVLDRCGHHPNIEKPKEFNQAVIDFLNKRLPPQ
jgi:pimeloyl-ACP methyl ester carboxylesterase